METITTSTCHYLEVYQSSTSISLKISGLSVLSMWDIQELLITHRVSPRRRAFLTAFPSGICQISRDICGVCLVVSVNVILPAAFDLVVDCSYMRWCTHLCITLCISISPGPLSAIWNPDSYILRKLIAWPLSPKVDCCPFLQLSRTLRRVVSLLLSWAQLASFSACMRTQ